MVNIQKAAVIGCGFVGSTIAYTLMQKGLFSEMVLLDANKAKAEGEAMDISHGLPFTHAMDIYAGEYCRCVGRYYYGRGKPETGRDETGSCAEKCSDYAVNHKRDQTRKL